MDKLLTPKQVANKLGVSEYTIWRYIKAGKLKAIKLTLRNFRIEEKDLIQFLKKHKTK
ncbi:MAG: helix-turn-helix domain-containing protein [bacterium]|nr:helix-turn-helix domain-containing protein [bacterium]